jgi:TetR/AcrR family transcriptional regulator, transcriptional repressor for nem operon
MKTVPSTDRGRATLARIIDTASTLFYRQGVRATGLDQIIEISQTGKGQLYHYFADKADLVLAVIQRQVDEVIEAQEPLLADLDSWADIDAWLVVLIDLHEGSEDPVRCPLGALAAELAEGDPTARAALAEGFGRWTDLIAAGLRRVRDDGGLRPGADPDALAQGALAAYQGGLLLAQVEGSLVPLHAALDTARAALYAASSTTTYPAKLVAAEVPIADQDQ